MRLDHKADPGLLSPAGDPSRESSFVNKDKPYVFLGEGTGKDSGYTFDEPVGVWLRRFRQWRGAFEQQISPNVRKYWSLYRNFDHGPLPGPNQEWRDRTVIPECFKIIETRLPRKVMGQFGAREWFSVEGRDGRDEQYEELVRTTIQTTVDEIGKDRPETSFKKIMVDALRYGEIMGHVWIKTFWRDTNEWLKTQVKDEEGKWIPIEALENTYNGVDVSWLGVSDLAIDTSRGDRRWCIERFKTSVESLNDENENHKKATGEPLYDEGALAMLSVQMGQGAEMQEGFEEPRDTEGWPLSENEYLGDPNETSVELWLCWDNVKRTLTKVANRSIILDEGLAPTPNGLDPYIGVPTVPIPGRAYGESILHYVGPLCVYQTRLARARADEILLNIWQQFAIREGSLRSSQFLFRPGGVITLEMANPDRPLSDVFMPFNRRPVFQESWQEEGQRQAQAEATAAADPVNQGAEATSKSRDVSATEIQQRVLQGASRYQMENFYLEAVLKGPLLRKVFDLLRQNLTKAKQVRVMGEELEIDLRDLERPIDIVVGGGLREMTKAERNQETQELIELSVNPKFGPYIKPREVLSERFKSVYERKDPNRFLFTEEEVQREQAKQAMAMQAMAQSQAGSRPAPAASPVGEAPQPSGSNAGGAQSAKPPGPSGGSGTEGNSTAPAASGSVLAEV